MHKTIRGKCVLLGSAACGKTSIVQTFCSDGREFPRNYCMSVTAELVVKSIIVPEANDNVVSRINIHWCQELFIYTLPGKEVFADLLPKYVSQIFHIRKQKVDQINMLMAVFDLTDKSSFTSAQAILTKYSSSRECCTIPTVLVGNKTDLEARRTVDFDIANSFAQKLGVTYFEASAKEATGIEAPFLHLVREYYNLYLKRIDHFQNLI
ncbi:Intraflagellar transport protein 27 [Fasciola hepatica]|uniref:Intraflagellar transport protein 27 n=1 Tax=Fasciola hepatica TaxID=6192 RepID=A0A4E0RM52_FASHE|nr:Intraflagellar transport protein 27 [Fasciola hepatica]